MIVRRKTPPEVVEALEAAIERAFDNPDYQERMSELGSRLAFRGSEEFEQVMSSEREQASTIIEEINVEAIEQQEAPAG